MREIIEAIHISHGSVFSIFEWSLGYEKLSERGVPLLLIIDHKCFWVTSSNECLELFNCIHNNTLEIKQSVSPGESGAKKTKVCQLTKLWRQNFLNLYALYPSSVTFKLEEKSMTNIISTHWTGFSSCFHICRNNSNGEIITETNFHLKELNKYCSLEERNIYSHKANNMFQSPGDHLQGDDTIFIKDVFIRFLDFSNSVTTEEVIPNIFIKCKI